MSNPESDQRDQSRTPIELKVEYKKLNAFFFDYTRNISRGGTFIKTDRPLNVGTEFTFKLVVPQLTRPLLLKGRVKWVITAKDVATGDGMDPGMGIQFIYETNADRQMVDDTVQEMMISQLGERAYAKLTGKA